MPRLEMENCAFGLEFVTARKAGYIFGFFAFYVIEHSVARHSALSYRGMTNLGQEWSFSNRNKYSVGQQSALSNRGITNLGQEWSFSDRNKHSVAR